MPTEAPASVFSDPRTCVPRVIRAESACPLSRPLDPPWGLGIDVPRFGGWVPEGVFQMHAEGVLAEPPGVDIDLAFTNTQEGATDTSTGLPAAELSGPYTASVSILNPSRGEQFAYVTIGALVPALAGLVLWVLLRVVSSIKRGLLSPRSTRGACG